MHSCSLSAFQQQLFRVVSPICSDLLQGQFCDSCRSLRLFSISCSSSKCFLPFSLLQGLSESQCSCLQVAMYRSSVICVSCDRFAQTCCRVSFATLVAHSGSSKSPASPLDLSYLSLFFKGSLRASAAVCRCCYRRHRFRRQNQRFSKFKINAFWLRNQ